MERRGGVTVERLTSPLVLLGALVSLPSLAVTIHPGTSPLNHALLLYAASFGLYCTGVAGNLVSTLRGGEPRPFLRVLPLLASVTSLLLSIALYHALGPVPFLVLLSLWLALAGLHSLIEAGARGRLLGAMASLPWLAPVAVLMLSLGRGLPLTSVLMNTALTHVTSLAAWVGVGFLGKTYGVTYPHLYVAGLTILALGLGAGYQPGVMVALGLGLMLLALGFWRRPVVSVGFWWAQASASLGLLLVYATWLARGGGDLFPLLHGVLLGVGLTLVVGQSIYLAPLVIAVRRGRYPPGWVYVIFSVSGGLRIVEPVLAGVMVLAGLFLTLFALRPNARWVWLILRYGTVEGYARVYREKRGFE